MQKRSPKAISSDFKAQAKMHEEQRIALAAEKLTTQRKLRFDKMKERQELALKAEQERFANQREATVAAVAQNLLDQRLKTLSPNLVPRYLPGPSRREMAKAARQDAEGQVTQMEDRHLLGMKEKFLSDQQRFIEQAQSAERRLEFNRASVQGRQSEQSRADGRGGHGR